MSPSAFQILLIDDNESEAKLFENALREAAPRVKLYWVATAREGIEFLTGQGRFPMSASLIITDLNLPGMSGFEFIEEARRRLSTTIPIVVYSGSDVPSDVARAYALGASSYIVKPMTVDMAVRQIRVLVQYWLETVKLPDRRMVD